MSTGSVVFHPHNFLRKHDRSSSSGLRLLSDPVFFKFRTLQFFIRRFVTFKWILVRTGKARLVFGIYLKCMIFESSVLDPDPHGSAFNIDFSRLDPDLGGENHVFKCWMLFFDAWRLLLLIGQPLGDLWLCKLQCVIKKILIFFSWKFVQFFVIKTLDPDPEPYLNPPWRKILDLDPRILNTDRKTLGFVSVVSPACSVLYQV